MKKTVLCIILLLLCMNITYGQKICGSGVNLSLLQQENPVEYQRVMALENQTQVILSRPVMRSIPQSTIIIPVVVHIVYNNNAQNLSDVQINSQIQVLNEDFRRLNADRTNTPNAYTGVAGDANIEFRLAQIDPNGQPTTGITRTQTTVSGFSQASDDVKFTNTGGHNAWNTQRYLNIWVCNFSNTSLLGYAQSPYSLSTSPNTDGVVISYKHFGRGGSSVSPYDRGRTATHEVGHWLNLRHIWGDEDNCTATDFVDDTPNQYTWTRDCPFFPTTDACTTSNPGIMFMNYMDYTDDACMNLFTNGQIARMRALFDTQNGIRREMLTYAYLTLQITGPSVCPGTSGIFTVANLPAGVSVVAWSSSLPITFSGNSATVTNNTTLNTSSSSNSMSASILRIPPGAIPTTYLPEAWIRAELSGTGAILEKYFTCNRNIVDFDLPATATANTILNVSAVTGAPAAVSWSITPNTNVAWQNYSNNDIWLTFAQNGLYAVQASTTNDCGTYTREKQVTISGSTCSTCPPISLYVITYPNPASNVLNIELSQDAAASRSLSKSSNAAYWVKLYDAIGNVVYQQETNGENIQLNTSGLPNGLYYIFITDKANRMQPARQTIIVQH